MNRASSPHTDLVVALGNDRDVVHLCEQFPTEGLDLCRRHLATRKDAEVDPKLEDRRLPVRRREHQSGRPLQEFWVVCHECSVTFRDPTEERDWVASLLAGSALDYRLIGPA